MEEFGCNCCLFVSILEIWKIGITGNTLENSVGCEIHDNKKLHRV